MRAALGVVVVVALAGPGVSGQDTSRPAPAFEVASVKPTATRALTGPDAASSFRVSPSGLVAITNYPLRRLIVSAYAIGPGIERHSPEGGPAAILSARFDINAKISVETSSDTSPAAPAALQETARLMLRTLLSDRFKLRIRTETRQVPVFAITAPPDGKLGPELRASAHDCEAYQAARRQGSAGETPRDAKNRLLCTLEPLRSSTASPQGFRQMVGQQERYAGPLSRLMTHIQSQMDRPLVDATGLTGNFEWQLTTGFAGIDSSYPVMLTALQEQLGLKVESRTAAVDILVIDSVELPTPD